MDRTKMKGRIVLREAGGLAVMLAAARNQHFLGTAARDLTCQVE
jgi:hypothetical protein